MTARTTTGQARSWSWRRTPGGRGGSSWPCWRWGLALLLALLVSPTLGPAPSHAASAVPGGANTWTPVGNMTTARTDQTATLLPDGQVLIAGGCCDAQRQPLASAELYNPATGAFTSTTPMSIGRRQFTATLLRDGTVLVVGGCVSGPCDTAAPETYDPRTATWTPTGPFGNQGFRMHTATMLADGRVLITGGCPGFYCMSGVATAELYNPRTRGWSMTGNMIESRQGQTATLLPTGKVLIAGGCGLFTCSSTAELYDPTTGTFRYTRSMLVARLSHTATLLPSGKVLVAGGCALVNLICQSAISEAELYDPATETFTTTGSMTAARALHTATLLPSGKVLVTGGCASCYSASASAELYDPATGSWTATGALTTLRVGHTATLLPGGVVLATGGDCCGTAEVYQSGLGPLVQLSAPSLDLGYQNGGAAGPPRIVLVTNTGTLPLQVAQVALSGTDAAQFLLASTCTRAQLLPRGSCAITVQLAPRATGSFAASIGISDNAPTSPQTITLTGVGTGPYLWTPTGPMSTGRANFTLTTLRDGRVLVAGGCCDAQNNTFATAELYDPRTNTFTPTGSMSGPRGRHTATLLSDGTVLVAGGYYVNTYDNSSVTLTTTELYHPDTGTWTPAGAMATARVLHTATLLPSGKVLVTGGNSGDYNQPVASAELYDPSTGTFTTTGTMSTPRQWHTATLLPSGKVLIAGGCTSFDSHWSTFCWGVGLLSSAELYDPATGAFTATGSLITPQGNHTATLLADGRVLVAGGSAPNSGIWPITALAETYDPATGVWTAAQPMAAARVGQTPTLLPNGEVLVTGGFTSYLTIYVGYAVVTDTEVYNPLTNAWTQASPLSIPREYHAATLLANGDVLVAGGNSCQESYSCPNVASAQVYRPALLTALPFTGRAGQQVLLQGSNFFGHEPVRLYWDSATTPPLATTLTTQAGALTALVTVPTASPGPHVFLAVGLYSGGIAVGGFALQP